jgi:hypothetical protein
MRDTVSSRFGLQADADAARAEAHAATIAHRPGPGITM